MPKPVDEQRAEFNAGIVAVHKAFAEFENRFAWLLSALLNASHQMVVRLYFSLNATEARVGLVDAVMPVALERLQAEMRPRMEGQWRRVMDRASRARKTRNNIIHGQVLSVGTEYGEVLRLAPLLADSGRLSPMFASGQLPGMSANDLMQNATLLDTIAFDVASVMMVFLHADKSDWPASLQKLAELEARHPTAGDPPKADPTPQAPPSPPGP